MDQEAVTWNSPEHWDWKLGETMRRNAQQIHLRSFEEILA
jgi:hypothetical protein